MTKCHPKKGVYHFETLEGMRLVRMVGRQKFYSAKCSACGKKHSLTEKEAKRAVQKDYA